MIIIEMFCYHLLKYTIIIFSAAFLFFLYDVRSKKDTYLYFKMKTWLLYFGMAIVFAVVVTIVNLIESLGKH